MFTRSEVANLAALLHAGMSLQNPAAAGRPADYIGPAMELLARASAALDDARAEGVNRPADQFPDSVTLPVTEPTPAGMELVGAALRYDVEGFVRAAPHLVFVANHPNPEV